MSGDPGYGAAVYTALWGIQPDAATVARVEAAVRGLHERARAAMAAVDGDAPATPEDPAHAAAAAAAADSGLTTIGAAAPDGAIAALARDLASGAATASALLEERLARIDADASIAACFVNLDRDGARAAARALDGKARSQWPSSGLAGVPIAHKDIFAERGRVTTFGAAPALHRGAATTATALTRLAAAGAVNLGGLHMSEFALGPAGFSENYGFIDNPAVPASVSGGSSSGSGAAVAHGIVAGTLGTDTGGSIRLPAAFCGVIGLKPTNGIVPADGVQPLSTTLDCVGPMAADVAGVARMLDVLTSAAPAAAPGRYERALTADPRALRVGVLAASSLPLPPEAAVAAAWTRAAAHLRDAGLALVDVAFPDLLAVNALAGIVFLSEGADAHAAQLVRDASLFGPQVRERMLQGLLLPAPSYLRAMDVRAAWRARWRRAVFASCDVLLMPVAPMPAPPRAWYADKDNGEILAFNARVGSYTSAFNYLGLPVLAVPTGIGIGMQLVAAPHRDADALRVGAVLERIARE